MTSTPSNVPGGAPEQFDGTPVTQIIYELFCSSEDGSLATNPLLHKLQLSERDVSLAIVMDRALAQSSRAQVPESVNLTRLVEARISHLLAVAADPDLLALKESVRQEKVRAETRRVNEELFADQVAASVRRALSVAVVVAPTLGAAGYFVGPVLFDLLNQTRMDTIATDALATRADGLRPVAGMDLEGASIQFACRATGVFDPVMDGVVYGWHPVAVEDFWNHDQLRDAFGVEWERGVPRGESIATAGWGTTVTFSKEQIAAGLPEALSAIAVEVPETGTAYILPSGAFIPDPDHLVNSVFTTGAVSRDGRLSAYYLMDSSDGSLACEQDEPIDPNANPVRMVTARLTKELPEKSLETFEAGDLEASRDFAEQFEKYDLKDWYLRTYPAMVKSFDAAIRDGSKRGISHEQLKDVAIYLKDREFEQAMLRILLFSELNYGKGDLNALCESVDSSRTPTLILTDEGVLRSAVANGMNEPGARGSLVRLSKDANVKSTLTHELVHAFFQGSVPKNGLFGGLRYGDFGPQDALIFEAHTAFFTQVGLGEVHDFSNLIPAGANHFGNLLVFQFLATEGGQKNALLHHYLLKPRLDLSPSQVAVLMKIKTPIPEAKATRHFYSMLLEQLDLSANSPDADLKRAEILFSKLLSYAQMNPASITDVHEQDVLAQEVYEILSE